jgi:predicted nucleic acid-binding protein
MVPGTGGKDFMEAVEFGTFVNNGMIEIPAEDQKDYFADFEDAVVAATAARENADFIVTRNAGD